AIRHERRGALSARALMLWSIGIIIFALGRYGAVTAPALYGRPINLYWDLPHVFEVAGMLARSATVRSVLLLVVASALALALLYAAARWSIGQIDRSFAVWRPVRLALGALGALLVASFLVQQA